MATQPQPSSAKRESSAGANSVDGKRGIDLLHDPVLNKATAYTEAERQALGLVGLVPDVTESEDLQLRRVMQQLGHKTTDLERYIYLVNLLDNDETLFYRTLMSDPARFLPIVYDPTIAEACLKFGHIYRRARGMYLSITRKGHVKEVLRNWPVKDVRVICVTDGGRILGLGDLGANGMGIPIGKLQLYTAAPACRRRACCRCTSTPAPTTRRYLNDPLYLGLRRPRPSTEELYAFVDEFVEAVQEVFPNCCIHFEDWTGQRRGPPAGALPRQGVLLQRRHPGHRRRDARRADRRPQGHRRQVQDQRILFLGAGSAAIGLADLIASAMVQQGCRARGGQAADLDVRRQRPRRASVRPGRHKLPYVQTSPSKPFTHLDLAQRVPRTSSPPSSPSSRRRSSASARWASYLHPAGHRGDVAAQRPAHHLRPLQPDRARGMHCRGSLRSGPRARRSTRPGCSSRRCPYGGQTFLPRQANNFYIFPAVGMAIYATQAKRVTDEMFIEAAHALADQVTPSS